MRGKIKRQALADGVFIPLELFGHGFADQNSAGATFRVAIADVAAAEKWNAHRAQVAELMTRTLTSGMSAIGTTGRPSMETGCIDPSSLSGKSSINPADSTPGSARTRSSTRS